LNINNVSLPSDLIDMLTAIYKKLKDIEPGLTESIFFERIIKEWLEPYRRNKRPIYQLKRDKVILKNDIKKALQLCDKSQSQIAREIGVNRVYLSQVINGKFEPSIVLAFLIADALNYPAEKIKDLFYLEPADWE